MRYERAFGGVHRDLLRRPLLARCVAFACWGVQLAGCREVGPAAPQELADLTTAIDRLRDAPNPRKRPALRALRAIRCDVYCPLKQACREAYELHLGALEQMGELRDALQQEGSEPPSSSHEKLAELRASLERAHELTRHCAALEGEAKRGW